MCKEGGTRTRRRRNKTVYSGASPHYKFSFFLFLFLLPYTFPSAAVLLYITNNRQADRYFSRNGDGELL
jgi:hypothetical protein